MVGEQDREGSDHRENVAHQCGGQGHLNGTGHAVDGDRAGHQCLDRSSVTFQVSEDDGSLECEGGRRMVVRMERTADLPVPVRLVGP